jgi:hypothetical protein
MYYIFAQSQIAVVGFRVTNRKHGFEDWAKVESSILPSLAHAFHDNSPDAMQWCLQHSAAGRKNAKGRHDLVKPFFASLAR